MNTVVYVDKTVTNPLLSVPLLLRSSAGDGADDSCHHTNAQHHYTQDDEDHVVVVHLHQGAKTHKIVYKSVQIGWWIALHEYVFWTRVFRRPDDRVVWGVSLWIRKLRIRIPLGTFYSHMCVQFFFLLRVPHHSTKNIQMDHSLHSPELEGKVINKSFTLTGMERQIDINSINKRALQLIRELCYWIDELSNSITDMERQINRNSNI